MNKKAFAKVVTKIRKELGTKEYPKAMMTSRQIDNCTATINCTVYRSTGYDGDSKALALAVRWHPALLPLLSEHRVSVVSIEPIPGTNEHYQVRLRWPQDVVGMITETIREMEDHR